MLWQTTVSYRKGPLGPDYEMSFHVTGDDGDQVHEQIRARMDQTAPNGIWTVVLLKDIPTGPFVHGQVTDNGFEYPCGCWMAPNGHLSRCQAHGAGGGGYVGDDAIMEAVEAMGLLKERRPTYTCETCGTATPAPPMIGDMAGRFTWPRGWESEEWQATVAPPKSGKAVFCSRRCRGKWLIKTDEKLRKP